MKYRITHIPTNESRIYEDAGDYDIDWVWNEGNYGCDCNRFLFFERAGGKDFDDIKDCPPCGTELYSVEFLQ